MLIFEQIYEDFLKKENDVEKAINNTLTAIITEIVSPKDYTLMVKSTLYLDMETGNIILNQKFANPTIIIHYKELTNKQYNKETIETDIKYYFYTIFENISNKYKNAITCLNSITYSIKNAIENLKKQYSLVMSNSEIHELLVCLTDTSAYFSDNNGELRLIYNNPNKSLKSLNNYIKIFNNLKDYYSDNLDLERTYVVITNSHIVDINAIQNNSSVVTRYYLLDVLQQKISDLVCKDLQTVNHFKNIKIIRDNSLYEGLKYKIKEGQKYIIGSDSEFKKYICDTNLKTCYVSLYKKLPLLLEKSTIDEKYYDAILGTIFKYSININPQISELDFNTKQLPQNLTEDNLKLMIEDTYAILMEFKSVRESTNLKETLDNLKVCKYKVNELLYKKANKQITIKSVKLETPLGKISNIANTLYFINNKYINEKELKSIIRESSFISIL